MKILIIGSKGFIGRHCINYFTTKGFEIIGCDIIQEYNSKNYYVIDSSNSDFKDLFKIYNFDICINASGAADVANSVTNPCRDFSFNTINVFKILDAIYNYQPECKFINISSAAVYGNPQNLPINEGHEINPISPYGYHKAMAENICKEFHLLYNIKITSIRIFSAYGEGLKKQLFWDLFNKNKLSNSIEIFGSGYESRDFIYINDVMTAIDLIIKNDKFDNSVYNIANGEEIKINKAVEIFFSIFDSKTRYTFNNKSINGYPTNWVADITKLKAIGYKTNFTLEHGLKNYVKWLKELK